MANISRFAGSGAIRRINSHPHLAPFLTGHPFSNDVTAIRSAVIGGAIRLGVDPDDLLHLHLDVLMMGGEGLRRATEMAILNANYIANRLDAHFPVNVAIRSSPILFARISLPTCSIRLSFRNRSSTSCPRQRPSGVGSRRFRARSKRRRPISASRSSNSLLTEG